MRLNRLVLAGLAGTMATACVAMGPAQTTGSVLTNPSGMTLYVFDKDVAESGKSACNGEGAEKWPPLMASASDKSSGGYSVISRNEGSKRTETGFRHAREDGVEVFYWVDSGFGYAPSGNVEKAEMGRLADIAYHQISN